MFHLIASAISAYNQLGMFLGGLLCLGLGGLLLGDSLYWRIHARRVSGTILGVIQKGSMYTPVYRYALSDGQTHEAKSDISSGSPVSYRTGRAVSLLVSPENPSHARTAGNYLLDAIGLVLIAPGLWLGYTALTAYPVTRMTWIMAAAMLVYLAERAHSLFRSGGPRISFAEWKRQANLASPKAIDLAQVKPAEQFLSAKDGSQSVAAQINSNPLVLPIVAFFAVALALVGCYQGYRMARLESAGIHADGEVIDLKEESSNHGYSYYPIVRFPIGNNRSVQFKDGVGSDPPSYEVGERVRVLYLADDLRVAIIDRGIWNWIIPSVFVVAAFLLVWLFVFLRSQRGGEPLTETP
jgi:hypothetical protein